MIIDAHMVIGPYHPAMPPSEVDELLAYMERSGLDQMVTRACCSSPTSSERSSTARRPRAVGYPNTDLWLPQGSKTDPSARHRRS